MSLIQISVNMENQPGKLTELYDLLEKELINIKAITTSSSSNFIEINMVLNDPEKAKNVLEENNYTITEKEVIAVAVPDHPGGLNSAIRPLQESNIDIESLYPMINLKNDEAIVILVVNKIEEARSVLKKHWVKSFNNDNLNS